MPNYTKNILEIRGDSELLKYFYDKNRNTTIDHYMLNRHVTELSFENFVSRSSCNIMTENVSKYYLNNNGLKDEKNIYNIYNIYDNHKINNIYWGTKWDAIDVIADKSKINEDVLIYRFLTAWNYPENWIIIISEIFEKLDFYITYTNEDDGYDMVYKKHYKNGNIISFEKYSDFYIKINSYGDLNIVIDKIINFLNNNQQEYELELDNERENEIKKTNDWLEYSKMVFEGRKKIFNKINNNPTFYFSYRNKYSNLMSEIYSQHMELDKFLEENGYEINVLLLKDFSNLFEERVKKMI